jgi:hypothetical protein
VTNVSNCPLLQHEDGWAARPIPAAELARSIRKDHGEDIISDVPDDQCSRYNYLYSAWWLVANGSMPERYIFPSADASAIGQGTNLRQIEASCGDRGDVSPVRTC